MLQIVFLSYTASDRGNMIQCYNNNNNKHFTLIKVWNIFLCLLILFNFLRLYEITWNSYLSQSWRCVLAWECPYAVCVRPATVVGELDAKWAWAVSSPGVRWQLPPWWKSWLELGGLRPEPRVSQGFSQSRWLSQPYWGRDRGLRGWPRSTEGVGLLLGGWDSSLCLGLGPLPGPEVLGLHFCAGFTFPAVCVP